MLKTLSFLFQIFEVTTTTRIKDLCRNISRDLRLSSSDGYSLFVKTANKVSDMILLFFPEGDVLSPY